ncbi:MAG TPA: CPBP family intramembrane glutamic endopeptidase [Candidatus Krumholzibacteria bacterium]|nr:CPBP family intramembrane glutamic endopeptidase [Candidatus Krumholzibacteria bacterium]
MTSRIRRRKLQFALHPLPSTALMSWIAPILSLAAILLTTGLRYRAVGLRHAAPFPLSEILSPTLSVVAGIGLLALAVVLFLRGWKRIAQLPDEGADARRTAERRRALWQLLLFPALFALVWVFIPSGAWQPLHYVLVVFVALLLLALLVKEEGWRELLGGAAGFSRSLRFLLWPTLLASAAWILLVVLLNSHSQGGASEFLPRWHSVMISLLSYPLYALLQLSFFLAFAMGRLRVLGASARAQLLVPATLFALIHWPNAWIMGFAFLAILLWAVCYRRWRNLPAVALSMAVLATVVTQAPLENLTEHLRTGPGYVLNAYLQELYRYQGDLERECLKNDGSVRDDSALYFREILGQEKLGQEYEHWVARWEREWRARSAADFYRGLAKASKLPYGESYCLEQGRAWSSEKRWRDCGENWRNFIAALYREVGKREAAASELAAWDPHPSVGLRKTMIHRLFKSPEYFARRGTPAWRIAHLAPLIPPRDHPLLEPEEAAPGQTVTRENEGIQ